MYRSAQRTARLFDNSKPLLFGRDDVVEGEPVKTGQLVAESLPIQVRMRLWLIGRAHTPEEFERATGREVPAMETEDQVTMVEGKSKWFTIDAPWLDEPVKVQGEAKAQARADELREAGEPDHYKGVGVTETGGGWYHVKADWLDTEEKIQGKAAANQRAVALRAETPPAEWDGTPVPLREDYDPAPGDVVQFGEDEPRYVGIIDEINEGVAAITGLMDESGALRSSLVPVGELRRATEEQAEALNAALDASDDDEADFDEGDIVVTGEGKDRTVGRVQAIVEGNAALMIFDADGEQGALAVPVADLQFANEEEAADFAKLYQADADEKNGGDDAQKMKNN